MHQWPDYVFETVRGVVRPTLKRSVTNDEVAFALNLLRVTSATAKDIARACGLKVPAFKARCARMGIRPAVPGHQHYEGLYDWSQIREVVTPAGMSPRQFLEVSLQEEIERENQEEERNGLGEDYEI